MAIREMQALRVRERSRAVDYAGARVIMVPWHRLALGSILLLAVVLNSWDLSRLGYGNSYYAAAVRSMMQSWHNFFFNSFDPGGFVTIDKPPLGFWFQVVSAKLFGFNGISLLLPSLVAGILSVWLLYVLVGRVFGRGAGLLSALVMAVTPVAIATNRSNIIDSILVLFLILAAWALSVAAARGSLRWLLLCAMLVGLAFNVKMLEAYLAVPAFAVVYLLGASTAWWKRIIHMLIAAVVMLVVSLSWALAVDLTPASQRPWVDSTSTNSEIDLATGYNGLQRLTGQGGPGGGGPGGGGAGGGGAPGRAGGRQPAGGATGSSSKTGTPQSLSTIGGNTAGTTNQSSVPARPAAGSQPATGTQLGAGAQLAPGMQTASGSQPGAGAQPAAGSQPALGSQTASGSLPAAGSQAATGAQLGAGMQPATGSQTAPGSQTGVATQFSAGSQPGTGIAGSGAPVTGATGSSTSGSGFPGNANGNGGGPGGNAGGPGGNGGGPGGGGGGPGGGGPGGGGMFGTGNPGWFRLFGQDLGGQASWLLPLAAIGFLVVVASRRFRPTLDREQQTALLWGIWLLTTAVFFSVAGFFHQYYLVTMAAPIAALSGIGVSVLWQQYCARRWLGLLLPIALPITAAVQVSLLQPYPSWSSWLEPLIYGMTGIGTVMLILARLLRLHFAGALAPAALGIALASVLVAPAAWAANTATSGGGGGTPSAGPSASQGGPGGGGSGSFGGNIERGESSAASQAEHAQPLERGQAPTSGQMSKDGPAPTSGQAPRSGRTSTGLGPSESSPGSGGGSGNAGGAGGDNLLQYLLKHQGKTKFLVAVGDSNSAASYIIQTGKPVMSMGGFTGSDPILTLDRLKTLIKTNAVRFFQGVGGRGSGGDVSSWVQSTCKAVTVGANGTATVTSPSANSSATKTGSSGSGGQAGSAVPGGSRSTLVTDSSSTHTTLGTSSNGQGFAGGPQGGGGGFGGMGGNNQQLYDCAGAVK